MSASAEPHGLQQRVRLAPLTSLKVGGEADFYLVARSTAEALTAMRWARERGLVCRWIGGGSNLLIADEGLAGLVGRYTGAAVELASSQAMVIAEAGQPFASLARRLARHGWSGLEWAANVPGTVGGAVVNNAGAFGGCVADVLLWTDVLFADGRLERLAPAALAYAYRTSVLKQGTWWPALVVRAAFRVRPAPAAEATARVRELQAQRTASQPRQLSAGSVFANPPGDYAGRLIEAAGLKGHRVGGAQISPRHANFIVNLGGASARDVYALIRLAQDAVWKRFGIWLRPEIELLGRWSAEERAALLGPRRGAEEPA